MIDVLTSPKKRKKRFHLPGSEPETDVFWYPALKTTPPSNYTPGLIPLLRKYLLSSHAKGKTVRAVLCYNRVVHVSKQLWDLRWGCGYRNFLMVCTALMDQSIQPTYSTLLNQPLSPGIRNLQRWIEDAWKAGFDLEGAEQLKGLVGSKKWLGTSDLYTAFVSRGIPCGLIDFLDLNKRVKGSQLVIDWIVQYFSPPSPVPAAKNVNEVLRSASPVVVTDKMPLILQHEGHSRIVIGYEVLKNNDINLLVFESGYLVSKATRRTALQMFDATSNTEKTALSASNAANTSTFAKRQKLADNHSSPAIHLDDTDEQWSTEEVVDVENDIVCIGEKRRTNPDDKKTRLEIWSELTPFRLASKKLNRNKYQILYFPMEAPLTDNQKDAMKVVTTLPV